jgi:hypothetical protein
MFGESDFTVHAGLFHQNVGAFVQARKE